MYHLDHVYVYSSGTVSTFSLYNHHYHPSLPGTSTSFPTEAHRPLNTNFPFSPPSRAWLPPFTLHAVCTTWTLEVLHTSGPVQRPVRLAYFTRHSVLTAHPYCNVSCLPLPLCGRVVFHYSPACVCLPYFVSPYKS